MKFVTFLFINVLSLLSELTHINTKVVKITNSTHHTNPHKSKKYYKRLFHNVLHQFKSVKGNITHYLEILYLMDNFQKQIKNHTQFNQSKTVQKKINSVITNMKESVQSFHQLTHRFNCTFSKFDRFIKKNYAKIKMFKKKRGKKTNEFYNSLVMLMLSMLTSGLIGMLVFLYFTSEKGS